MVLILIHGNLLFECLMLCFYSQAVVVDNTMYISGCLGFDPASGNLVSGGIEPEANQVNNQLIYFSV